MSTKQEFNFTAIFLFGYLVGSLFTGYLVYMHYWANQMAFCEQILY